MSMIKIARRREADEAFTVLELIIVIVIVGILAAIAIPIFSEQQKRAWASTAQSDVRNIATDIEKSWNEDEGYPLGADGPISPDNTVRFYADGEFVSSAGDDYENDNGSSGGTGGTGGDGGTGATPGNGDGTYKPSTNRMLTWEEFQAANKYDTGTPFAAQAAYYAVGKVGNAMSFDFNYTAGHISSASDLMTVLKRDCATVYFGYNRFLPLRTSADEQGQNLCNFIRESDAMLTSEEALSSLSVFKLTSSSQKQWSVNGRGPVHSVTESTPFEYVADWSFPATGTYTIIITKSPTDLFANCNGFSKIDSDGDGVADRYPRQGEDNYYYYCVDYGNGYDQGNLPTRELYDINILYTSTTNQAFSGRPAIDAAFVTDKSVYESDGTYSYITAQGGRYCQTAPVGTSIDCGGPSGVQFSMTDDLPESWWSNYLNGSGGGSSGGGGNTTTPDANGGVKADASNNTFAASFCVEGFNANVPEEWFFYSSDTKKVQSGRCPT
ncbi:hypothetical protein AB0O65_10695 [Microbacterium sp. NPDC077391]|uniref:hypothetical protein n=1 Tax=Microbacterium sp. NPDC077391 TaxID=3154765 RepID=UPI00342454D8